MASIRLHCQIIIIIIIIVIIIIIIISYHLEKVVINQSFSELQILPEKFLSSKLLERQQRKVRSPILKHKYSIKIVLIR